jgi:hypothetical protein
MKAKTVSLIGKAASVLFLVAAYIVTAVTSQKIPNADEVFGQIQIAVFIASAFLPVDISLIVQNIKGLRNVSQP